MRRPGRVLDSKGIQELFQEVAEKHPDKYKDVALALTKIGGEASYSKGGLSFGVQHLKPAMGAKIIRAQLRRELDGILADRSLSPKERELKLIEAVDKRRKPLEDAVYDESLKENNPLALQVLSGVRGKKMNLRSLRGGDLLYTDNRDRIIPVPVLKSYSEGLSPAEYWAGAFGARRGVVEVKMATADAGFLCLDEDTLVRMADGSAKAIKGIAVGDAVLGANVRGETFPTRVTAVFDNGERDVERFRFRIGKSRRAFLYIDATADHNVLAKVKRGRPTHPRGAKATIATPTKLPLRRSSGAFRLVPTQGRSEDWGVREPRALLLGLLLGGGGMSGRNLHFSCGSPSLIRELRPYMQSLGLRLKKVTNHAYEYLVVDRCPLSAARGNDGRVLSGTFRHRIRSWLSELGLLGKTAPHKFIPDVVHTWDNHSVAQLVAGLIATDGCVHSSNNSTTPMITLAMSASQVIVPIRRLLAERFGIHAAAPALCKVVAPRVRTSNGRSYIVKSNHPMHAITISDRRSAERVLELIPTPGRRGRLLAELFKSAAPQSRSDEFLYSFVDRVALGRKRTHDIEVDHPDHLFVLANGAIVSNSKQLVQAAHRLIVTNRDEPHDPKAPLRGLMVDANDSDNVGSLLAHPAGGYPRNTVVTPKILKHLQDQGVERLLVRSPIVGGPAEGGVYAKDVGVREKGDLPPIGDYVGIAAVQALGEKTSQGMLCLAEDEPVRMADGSAKPIKDVRVGEMVLGANVANETFPVEVTAVFDNGERECLRYEFFDYGRRWYGLSATPDHKVLFAKETGRDRWDYHVGPLSELDADDGYLLYLACGGATDRESYASLVSTESLGKVRTRDIEVDHPDHLFVLATGLVVSNSSKHSGGVAGANAASSGFKAINALVNPPKIFPGAAAHAQLDGRVSSVEPATQGGWNVSIDGQRHYVPAGYEMKVKPGDEVEAGDMLSTGVPNPAEIVKHKGVGEGRRYFVDTFRDVFKNSGLYGNRRNIELLARGLIDHVKLTDEVGEYAPDDVVPYSALERDWTPRPGAVTTSPSGATGKYLERPVLHYSIGTKVRPSMLPHFKQFGVDRLEVHHEPPPFQPHMVRGMSGLANDPEWAVRHLGSSLEKSTLQAAHRGSTTDTRGTSFVSALLDPVSFGREGQTQGWKAADLLEDDLLDL